MLVEVRLIEVRGLACLSAMVMRGELRLGLAGDQLAWGMNSMRKRTDLGMMIPVTSGVSIIVWLLTSNLIHAAFEYAPSVGIFDDHARSE